MGQVGYGGGFDKLINQQPLLGAYSFRQMPLTPPEQDKGLQGDLTCNKLFSS